MAEELKSVDQIEIDERFSLLMQLRADAERYRKLEAWMKRANVYVKTESTNKSWPQRRIFGPTFDAAVDALPEPEDK